MPTPTATPAPSTVDVTALSSAILYAQSFMSSDEYANCSAPLKEKWQSAYDEATAVLQDANHTQDACDAAANHINNLAKTGESLVWLIILFVLIGAAIVAGAVLAIVLVARKKKTQPKQ